MKLSFKFKSVFIEVVCLMYVLLFVYAAVSKILDFERFQIQLAQSPLLSAFASWISWIVIGMELIIALLLMLPKSRIAGLYAALSLMTMFTTYIFIILHYSSFVPCSCGGILEKMTWNVHLIFNLIFMVLALIALVIGIYPYGSKLDQWRKRFYFRFIVFSILVSTMFVAGLFLLSEDIIHNKNPFIRRYPQYAVELFKTVDLKFNSYYFAGIFNGNIYLGNYTDPLHLLAIDSLGHKKNITLQFNDQGIAFQTIRIVIRGKYIYLMDGIVPAVFRGNMKDLKITTPLKGMPGFISAEPIDSTTIAFRTIDAKSRANVLGIFYADQTPGISYAPYLLKQQIDGVFDTDGMLLYNEELRQIIYTYFYRNEFIVADKNAALKFKGNTIDTIAHAKIKVAYLKGNSESQMGAPPFTVNAVTATRSQLLFVNSKVPGRYEHDKVWKQSSIVDVYNLRKNAYVLSFPIYGEKQKIKTMFVSATHLYVMIGTDMMIYKISSLLKKEMKSATGNVPDA